MSVEDDSNNYDAMINALGGVDILQVEAVGAVIGRCVGKIYQGMLGAGLSENQASGIVNGATHEFFEMMLRGPKP